MAGASAAVLPRRRPNSRQIGNLESSRPCKILWEGVICDIESVSGLVPVGLPICYGIISLAFWQWRHFSDSSEAAQMYMGKSFLNHRYTSVNSRHISENVNSIIMAWTKSLWILFFYIQHYSIFIGFESCTSGLLNADQCSMVLLAHIINCHMYYKCDIVDSLSMNFSLFDT